MDRWIYGVHITFWAAFGVTRMLVRVRGSAEDAAPAADAVSEARTAPFSRALLGFHMFGMFVMYFGLGQAVLPGLVPERFPLQRLAGLAVIALGAVLMCWALTYFRSWRLRAKLDAGHELATGGPFALLRHPIYMGMNLLALGTALWVPTALVASGTLLVFLGSDLRARAEEKLLVQAFGEKYRAYMASTKRFVPGIY